MLRTSQLHGHIPGRYRPPRPGRWPNRARIITACFLVVIVQLGLLSSASRELPPASMPLAEPYSEAAPIAFVANAGQLDPAVHFQADGLGGTIFFAADQVVLSLPDPMRPAQERGEGTSLPVTMAGGPLAASAASAPLVVRIGFAGADPAARLVGGQPLPEHMNYLTGNDPTRWRTGIATYAGISYTGLYPGVDLYYSGTGVSIKGTFVVAAGADPTAIGWRYSGADVAIDPSGALVVTPPGIMSRPGARPALTEQAPLAWQDIGGQRIAVPVRYALSADQSIRFELGSYDTAYSLIIDPTLEYGSYLGGSDNDQVSSITRDAAGFLYMVGSTQSSDFPTVNPLQLASTSTTCSSAPEQEYPCRDIFITKLSPDGRTKLFSTYISGNDHDYGNGIVIHGDGTIYITGGTSSSDFPVVDPAQPVYKSALCGPYPDHRRCQDMFVAQLSGDGSELLFSTLIGGMRDDYGRALAIGPQNDLYITGGTSSSDFPTARPFQLRPTNASFCYLNGSGQPYTCPDAFVLRMALDTHELVFSTYLGGSLHDEGVALAVDTAGDAYVAGLTISRNFPIAHALIPTAGRGTCATWYYEGCPDAFITKILSDGSQLAYSTYFGGDGFDRIGALAIDSAGEVYIAGQTNSTNLPLAHAFQPVVRGNDAFVAKLSADGQTLRFGTYLGGNSNDYGYGLALDAAGNMYISGTTQSSNFPIAHPFQATNAGDADAFVAKINPNVGALLFSTYLGGRGSDQGYSLVLGEGGNVYVAGTTASDNFPTRDPFQPALAGAIDTFIATLALPQTTLLINKLRDDTSGLPIANAAGLLSVYQDTALLDRFAFSTDAAGVYTATLNAPLGPIVRLEYSGIPGYGHQYYNRQPSLDQAEPVVLCACPTRLTTRLLPAATLVNTLLDALTGRPLGGVVGTLSVYSGTSILDTAPFTTTASGVYTTTFTSAISQNVRLEYSGVSGYRRQFYDGRHALAQADPVTLAPGRNSLTTHMLQGTLLVNTLIDQVSGAAVANTSGTLAVYSGTALLERQPFTTSATGVYTLSFASLISQSVRLEYTLSGYPRQYYDRKFALNQADVVVLGRGRNTLTTQLLPQTTLVATLRDQVTGLPIANTGGSVGVYSGTVDLASQAFTTDASGVYTATFSLPISQSVRLSHQATGYFTRYYDRKSTLAQADPVRLRYGRNTLATQLLPQTTLSNRLLNDATGLPINDIFGSLRVYSGTTLLENRSFHTDATGTYTVTFVNSISQTVRLVQRGRNSMPVYAASALPLYVQANGLAIVRL